MSIKFLGIKGTWSQVRNSALTTIGKDAKDNDPTNSWKRRLLLSEHSPIRQIIAKWKWYDLPYWVSTHFVRHWVGIVHWVRTQRTDRTGEDRNLIPQGAFVEHECEANAQAIITMSRKRLCLQASPETRGAWQDFLRELGKREKELVSVCVPDCVYRGYCFEYKTCGYFKTPAYLERLVEYRKGINQ